MSSTPERDAAGEWSGGVQQGVPPGAPSQPSAPGEERVGSAPSQASAPGQEQYGSVAPGGGPVAPQGGGIPANQQRSRPGRHRAPVNEAETRVTWRRVFQYWIDAFLVSVVPYIVGIPFDRSSRTSLHIIGGIVMFTLFLVIGFWYWIIRPRSHNGQTFAMKWFGLRVISKDGDQATTVQYFIRWISLIFDAFPWVWPLTGLLGLIVMVCSRYRQRGGDHLARTLVISTGLTAAQAAQYGRGGAPGMAGEPAPPGSHERPETGL
jgi:uncharacterized RDD family membrane protein YckC